MIDAIEVLLHVKETAPTNLKRVPNRLMTGEGSFDLKLGSLIVINIRTGTKPLEDTF